MKAVFDVLSQVFMRRRQGPLSLLAGIFLAPLWQVYKRVVRRSFAIRTWMGPLIVLYPDSVTSSRFVYEGRPDQDYIAVLSAFAGDDTAFVDVGANVGMYSVLLSRLFPNAWLFEPNPAAIAQAQRNLAINGLGDAYKIIEAAVASRKGVAAFPILSRPDPAASLIVGADVATRDVAVVTLDDTVPADRDLVVKIDAEGFDCEVLKGASGHLARGGIRIALFECHADDTLRCVLDCVGAHGYRVFDGEREITVTGEPRGRDLFILRPDLLPTYRRAVSEIACRGGSVWNSADGPLAVGRPG